MSGDIYFWNIETDATAWAVPPGVTVAKVLHADSNDARQLKWCTPIQTMHADDDARRFG